MTITPEAFGACGDGIADDTAAIQCAINQASVTASNVVLSGDYKSGPLCVTASLVASVGRRGRLIRLEGTTGPWLTINSDSISVEGIRLSGQWIPARGIEIERCSDASIRRVLFEDIGEHFIHFNGASWLTIDDVTCTKGTNGISNLMPLDSPDAAPSDHVEITRAKIRNVAGTAIHLSGRQSAFDVNFGMKSPLVKHFKITGNILSDIQGNGILCQGWHGNVADNVLDRIGVIGGNQGIVCQGKFINVGINTLDGGQGVGIDMGGCFNSTVGLNNISGFAQIGIELQSCLGVACVANSVNSSGFGVSSYQSSGINVANGYFGPAYFTYSVVVSSNSVTSGSKPGKYGISVMDGCSNVAVGLNNLVMSGSTAPSYIDSTASALWFGNHENAGEEKSLVLNTRDIVSRSGDLGITTPIGAVKYNKPFSTAASPGAFQAQVCIPVKDAYGSTFYIPAKYGTPW